MEILNIIENIIGDHHDKINLIKTLNKLQKEIEIKAILNERKMVNDAICFFGYLFNHNKIMSISLNEYNEIIIDMGKLSSLCDLITKYSLVVQSEKMMKILNKSDDLLPNVIRAFLYSTKRELRAKDVQDFVRLWNNGNFISGKEYSDDIFNGKIRTCLMEHSSDSRQHYYRGNVLQPRGWRRNIFSNYELGLQNMKAEWKAYSTVRGKVWRLRPGSFCPTTKQLNDNVELISTHIGMRGIRVNNIPDNYESAYNMLVIFSG
jgi:hypothetical protein